MIKCDTAQIQGCSDNTGTQCASWRGHFEASAHPGQLQEQLCVCVCDRERRRETEQRDTEVRMRQTLSVQYVCQSAGVLKAKYSPSITQCHILADRAILSWCWLVCISISSIILTSENSEGGRWPGNAATSCLNSKSGKAGAEDF